MSIYGPLDFVWDYPGELVPESIWILLKQETVSGSGISWAICKSAPRSRKITPLAPHHSFSYRPDVLPAAQPTNSVKALKAFTCHRESHSITCHPAEVTFSLLPEQLKPVLSSVTPQRCKVSWSSWHGYIPRWFTHLKMVGHQFQS